jgi:hypothetical protein
MNYAEKLMRQNKGKEAKPKKSKVVPVCKDCGSPVKDYSDYKGYSDIIMYGRAPLCDRCRRKDPKTKEYKKLGGK